MQSSNMSLEDIFLEVTQTKGKRKQAKGLGRRKLNPLNTEAVSQAGPVNQETDHEEEN